MEHLLLRCTGLTQYRGRVRALLMDFCGLPKLPAPEWDWTYLFGLPKKSHPKGQTNNLVTNTVLAFARHAAWIRRNFALYEQKEINIWKLFEGLLKAHLRLLYAADKDIFHGRFTTYTTLFRETEEGTLSFCF